MSKQKKRAQKRLVCLILIVIAFAAMAGVTLYYGFSRKDDVVDYAVDSIANANKGTSAEDNSNGITFAELAKRSYSFSRGAGGWGDDFEIEEDGSFHGYFHDSEMGETGDDYPNGCFYYCEYEGHFADIQKVDDYTYKMTMTDITKKNDKGEYIEDDIKYIPADPYALDGAQEIEIYLPGKPVDQISEEIQMWIGLQFMETKPEKLESIALVNVNQSYGIFSN